MGSGQDLASGRISKRVTYKHIDIRASTVCKYESKMQNIIILQRRYKQHVRQLGDDEKSVGRCDESGGWYRSGGTNKAGSGSIKRSSCGTTDIGEGVNT